MPEIDIEAVENVVKYSEYFGKDLISLKGIREKQDGEFVGKIIDQSLEVLRKEGINKIQEPSFFIGSVDFMVHQTEDGEKEFAIIETNGGNSRGLFAIHEKGTEILFNGLLETLKFTREDPLVLIGHPNDDGLLQEKFFLTEFFKKHSNLKFLGKRAEEDSGIVLGPYEDILPRLELDGNTPIYDGEVVDVMIGDGIVRRREEFEKKGMRGELNTVLANEVFPETDDKALTYESVKMGAEDLKKFRIHPLDYWSVSDREELIDVCKERARKDEEVVIKPYGGSGGNGVNIILEEDEVEEKVERSLEEFYSRFGKERRAFPYTICEKVNFRPTTWKGSERNFDIRIYVARKGSELVPCGGLARIALEPYSEEQKKKCFVVNLSGYEGIDVSRGVGISQKGLESLELTEQDFVDMFSASTVLFKKILENHEQVLESFIGERIQKLEN